MNTTVKIEMDRDFVEWWETTLMANDKSAMLIAWQGWKACRDGYEARIGEMRG